MKKGNEVIDIRGEYTLFNDNWISKYDTQLIDYNDIIYDIIDYTTIVEEVLIMPSISHIIKPGTIKIQRACIKLNKTPEIGDVLYVHTTNLGDIDIKC